MPTVRVDITTAAGDDSFIEVHNDDAEPIVLAPMAADLVPAGAEIKSSSIVETDAGPERVVATTMPKSITEESYTDEVVRHAELLLDGAREAGDVSMDYAFDNVADVLDGHDWFGDSYHGPADHGAIIEYALTREVEVERFADWWSIVESDAVDDTVEKLAYVVMESDVLMTVEERLADE